jgi:hypothetical protein
MKKVLSISTGSSTRDHTAEAEFLGEQFWISRQGTDGDFEKALELYRQNDGVMDALGVGGAEFYLLVNNRRYYFREIMRIREVVKVSKLADGNGIKHILEPRAVQSLREHGIELRGKKALSTTAVDRYGLARGLAEAGCQMTFGDFMFALDIPLPIHSLRTIHIVAALLLPIITRLPYRWFYPLGEEQEKEPSKKYSRFYEEADVIAGDFLQVWSHLPDDLSGKIIITNTTTPKNVEELQKRHLHILVTTTPRLAGRSFGTNVMEGVCRCLIDKPDDQITPEDLTEIIDRIPLKPQVHVLN